MKESVESSLGLKKGTSTPNFLEILAISSESVLTTMFSFKHEFSPALIVYSISGLPFSKQMFLFSIL